MQPLGLSAMQHAGRIAPPNIIDSSDGTAERGLNPMTRYRGRRTYGDVVLEPAQSQRFHPGQQAALALALLMPNARSG